MNLEATRLRKRRVLTILDILIALFAMVVCGSFDLARCMGLVKSPLRSANVKS